MGKNLHFTDIICPRTVKYINRGKTYILYAQEWPNKKQPLLLFYMPKNGQINRVKPSILYSYDRVRSNKNSHYYFLHAQERPNILQINSSHNYLLSSQECPHKKASVCFYLVFLKLLPNIFPEQMHQVLVQ